MSEDTQEDDISLKSLSLTRNQSDYGLYERATISAGSNKSP